MNPLTHVSKLIPQERVPITGWSKFPESGLWRRSPQVILVSSVLMAMSMSSRIRTKMKFSMQFPWMQVEYELF